MCVRVCVNICVFDLRLFVFKFCVCVRMLVYALINIMNLRRQSYPCAGQDTITMNCRCASVTYMCRPLIDLHTPDSSQLFVFVVRPK